MKFWHAIVRFFSLHPTRREGEPHYTCTADVIAAIRRDHYNYGRRHDDVIGRARADFEAACRAAEKADRVLTDRSTSGQL